MLGMKKENFKSLALGNESLRHSFRRSLPIEIAQIASEERGPEVSANAQGKWLGEDGSLFLLSFCAFFTVFYTFIF